MGGRISREGPCSGAGSWRLRIYAPFRTVAQRTAGPLRRRRRPRHLAIQQFRRLARAAQDGDSVLRLSAWNARSMVQSHLSTEAFEKVALLAVGGIPRFARRRGGPFYHGPRTAPGP